MFIKLVHVDNKSPDVAKILTDCCNRNGARLISLKNNYFGILSNRFDLSFGAEDSTETTDTTLLSLVNTYKCAKLAGIPYSPFKPGTGTFRDISKFCKEQAIEYVALWVNTNLGPELSDDTDRIDELLAHEDIIVERMLINYSYTDIILNKFGYVDIGAGIEFYGKNKDTILAIINAGLTAK